MKWIVIIVVCLIYGWVAAPINRRISNKVKPKWLAFSLSFAIGFCILLVLYTIAAMLGFSIYK